MATGEIALNRKEESEWDRDSAISNPVVDRRRNSVCVFVWKHLFPVYKKQKFEELIYSFHFGYIVIDHTSRAFLLCLCAMRYGRG